MVLNYHKVEAKRDPRIKLAVSDGHFATTHSHITSYMELSGMRTDSREAALVARLLGEDFSARAKVDTIVCMDGTEVIGAYLAQELTRDGFISVNHGHVIHIISPEYNMAGQILFRDNVQHAIKGMNAFVLMGSLTTGKTLETVIECLTYYGASISGAAAIFSAEREVNGLPIDAIFYKEDVPEYESYKQQDCPMCKAKKPVNALVNSFGFSAL